MDRIDQTDHLEKRQPISRPEQIHRHWRKADDQGHRIDDMNGVIFSCRRGN